MQVRQVPFLQEAGKSMPAFLAEVSTGAEAGASKRNPAGSTITEK